MLRHTGANLQPTQPCSNWSWGKVGQLQGWEVWTDIRTMFLNLVESLEHCIIQFLSTLLSNKSQLNMQFVTGPDEYKICYTVCHTLYRLPEAMKDRSNWKFSKKPKREKKGEGEPIRMGNWQFFLSGLSSQLSQKIKATKLVSQKIEVIFLHPRHDNVCTHFFLSNLKIIYTKA